MHFFFDSFGKNALLGNRGFTYINGPNFYVDLGVGGDDGDEWDQILDHQDDHEVHFEQETVLPNLTFNTTMTDDNRNFLAEASLLNVRPVSRIFHKLTSRHLETIICRDKAPRYQII